MDLLPFYSRLVATLHPCMSDVAEDLCSMLKGDFRFHVSLLVVVLTRQQFASLFCLFFFFNQNTFY